MDFTRDSRPVAKAPRKTETGLSLLELLVALVIGSLVSTLAIQGLGITLGLYDRVLEKTANLDTNYRRNRWWSDSVAGIMGCEFNHYCFAGDATSFSGLSINTVTQRSGVPVPLTWELMTSSASGTQLVLFEPGQPPLVLLPSLPTESEFQYLRHDGKILRQWEMTEDYFRLPLAVLIVDRNGRTVSWTAPLQRPVARRDVRRVLGIE